MRIAVDFDGTIVENQYPAIGAEKPYAVKILKKLEAEGDEIILWTARSGALLQDAVDWCESRGLKLSAVNSNHHWCVDHQNGFKGSRKIHADIFIDDRIIGGFPGWMVVYEKVSSIRKSINKEFSKREKMRRPNKFGKIFSIKHSPSRIQAIFINRKTGAK